jgi:FkbM family methyltransferase
MPIKRAIYQIGPLAKASRSLLNRVAPAGVNEVSIAGGDLVGLRMLVDLQSEKDLWLGTYEPELQAALREFARPGMVAYDVGANVGYITLLLVRAVGSEGKVFSFEPLPANLERLRANLAVNDLSHNVVIVPMAVGELRGRASFLVHQSTGMGKIKGSAGRVESYKDMIDVEIIDLDAFVFDLGHPEPDIIKIDIEGGEVLALPGMRRLLAEVRPLLLIELHGEGAAQVTWELLTTARYNICRMKRGYPRIEALEDLGWKAYVVGVPVEGEVKSSARRKGR